MGGTIRWTLARIPFVAADMSGAEFVIDMAFGENIIEAEPGVSSVVYPGDPGSSHSEVLSGKVNGAVLSLY